MTMNAASILEHTGLLPGRARKSDILRIWRLADEGGTLQATDMLRITSDPKLHAPCSMRRALLHVGCEEQDEA